MEKSFETVLDMAGIENFRFHDLRHTFADPNGIGPYPLVLYLHVHPWLAGHVSRNDSRVSFAEEVSR